MGHVLTSENLSEAMIRSEWDPDAEWPYPLPDTVMEIRAFVARLRRRGIVDEEAQNDVDEACHLIEHLTKQLRPRG